MRNKLILAGGLLLIFSILIGACQTEQEINYRRYYVNGKGLYERHCQNCHNADGTGLQNLYPPLTDTLFISQNKDKLACMIKYGLNQKIIINGKEYDSPMPGNNSLTDMDVAQLVVYISNSFGNQLGHYEVDQAHADLQKCK
ncbi:MAG TPA: cytochrome c [Daejeonella sp.]|nr:cytochrome c [Daejeonella sp.]